MIILNILRTLRGIAITVLFFAFGVGTQIYFPVSFPGVVDKSSPRPDVDPSVLSAESIEIPRLKEIGYSVPVTFNSDAVFRGNIIINGTLFPVDSAGALSTDGETGTGTGDTIRTYETIIASSGGVLSFQGMTGDLDLTAGTGISIDILEITNTDPGSGQNIFKTIDVPGIGAVVAGSNNDSLKLSAGSGINLAVDSNTKNIAISQNIANDLAAGGLVVAKDATSLESLGPGPPGYILESRGSALPVWVDPAAISNSSLSFADVTAGTSAADLTIGSGSVLSSTGTGVINATELQGNSWESPGDIGLLSPARGKFTDLEANGQIVFPGLSSGIARIDPAGRMISSNINLDSNDVTGFLPLSSGGTGASTPADARANLGLGSLALENTNTTALTNYLPLSGGTITGDLNVTKASPNNVFINTATGQYNSSGFKMYSNASSFGDYAGVNMLVNVADAAASKSTFVIDRVNYTGTYKAHLMQIDLNNDIFNIYPTTFGLVGSTAKITTASNANLSLVPHGIGHTIIGNAGTTSHAFNTNDDMFVSGRLEVDGMAYFDNAVNLTGNLNVTKASPNNVFINTATGQYNSSGFKMYSNASSFGDYAGVNMLVNVADAAASKSTFVIDRVNYTGTYKAHLMQIDLNNDIFNIYPTTFGLVGSTAKITTASNANLSLVPHGIGHTVIGNAGTTSHSFNTNDDLFVSGRLEVDGLSYFDKGINIQDSQAASVAAQIFNSSTGTNADGLAIKLGNPSSTTVASSNHFLSFETAGIGIVGSIQGNGGRGIQLAQNGIADYAEYMPKDKTSVIPDGSLVCMQASGMVTGCTEAQGNIVGIASPYPLIIAGENLGDGSVAVGLAGIVETRVSTASGVISPGDMIAVSNDAGVGVKAVTTGMVAGRALEGYSGSGTGKIKVIVSPQMYFASGLESEITNIPNPPPLSSADINSATISGSLNVLGRTVLAETSVTGRLSVGLLAIDGLDSTNGTASASINTLSEPLRLQSYALAGVDILDGKVTIDKSGNLVVAESVTAKKYNVDTSDVRSASLGKSVLPAGETRITIETTAVTEESAIFLTPIGEVSAPLFVAEQVQGVSFTAGISKPEEKEVGFKWFIVN